MTCDPNMENFAQINVDHLPYYVYRHAIDSIMRRLHGALKEHGQGRVGLSFPQHHKAAHGSDSTLGRKINIVSTDSALLNEVVKHLELGDILDVDAIHLSAVAPVPAGTPRATFKRRRNEERQRRHPDRQESDFDPTHPFFKYGKRVGKHQYRIIVEKTEAVDTDCQFNSYGLSSTASVPLID